MTPASACRVLRSAETALEITDSEGNTRTQENTFMNGAAIFHFAISTVPKMMQNILAKLDVTLEQVDLVLFHQANRYMLDYLSKKLKVPPEKTHYCVEDIGNTSGSTIPVVLADAIRAGKIRPGMLVLLVAFGVGLSWGAAAIRWPSEA
jgi:3-oxoacyl-[acyl-carrier-protein] synthase-3